MEQWTGEVNKIIYTNSKTITIDPRKLPKRWWNDRIERLWQIKKEKLKIYNRIKDLHTALQLKKSVNKLKLEIKKSKKESWEKFTSDLNNKTSGEMWKVLKVMKKSIDVNPILKDKDCASQFLNKNFP